MIRYKACPKCGATIAGWVCDWEYEDGSVEFEWYFQCDCGHDWREPMSEDDQTRALAGYRPLIPREDTPA